jgi:hypothetical protein
MRFPMLFCSVSLLCSSVMFAGVRDGVAGHGRPALLANRDVDPLRAATGPQAKARESALFNRLVGTWDVSYEIYGKGGKVRRYRGQAIYGWILDGGAMQEIWTSDAHDEEPQPYGTTVGFYDGKRKRWTAVWIYPAQGMTTVVTGGEVDGGIVLTGRDEAGAAQRWSINQIQADSFVWRFESSDDEGKTWRLLGVNHMHRHHGSRRATG